MSSSRSNDPHERLEGAAGDALPDDLSPALVRRIIGLSNRVMKRSAVDRFVSEQQVTHVSRALQSVLVSSVRGGSIARDAWLPIARWLIEKARDGDLETLLTIGAAADELGDEALAAILRFGPARKTLPKAARKREEAILNADSVVFPLSETRMIQKRTYTLPYAYGPVGLSEVRTLEQKVAVLLLTLTPSEYRRWIKWDIVVEGMSSKTWGSDFARQLVDNDWLELKHILALIAKRPFNDALAFEVVLNDRWGGHPKIHQALAHNPFTPSEVILPLLPLLPVRILRRLSAPGEAPSCVNDAASAVLGCAQT